MNLGASKADEIPDKSSDFIQGDDDDDEVPRPSLESRWLAFMILIGLTIINIRYFIPSNTYVTVIRTNEIFDPGDIGAC